MLRGNGQPTICQIISTYRQKSSTAHGALYECKKKQVQHKMTNIKSVCLALSFVCWGLVSLFKNIATVTSICTLTNVPPHRNTMPQTQNMTPNPVTVYRHRAGLPFCYPFIWNVTPEYTTMTHLF